jgi:glutathione S-transferase
MLTVHHLGVSQSERIVWLCEELGVPYELKRYRRNAHDRLAPPDYKALHPLGAAPVITDGDLTLAESGAIVEYIISRYGNGRLALRPDHPDYASYLYWFHFANGTLQHVGLRLMVLRRAELAADSAQIRGTEWRLKLALDHVETRLGQAPFFGGSELTAADIMIVFSLTTMRYFLPLDMSGYPNILAYLQRIGARPAYQRAMKKGDPEMAPLLT